jgi:hypothetical protein
MRSRRPGSPARSWVTNSSSTATTPRRRSRARPWPPGPRPAGRPRPGRSGPCRGCRPAAAAGPWPRPARAGPGRARSGPARWPRAASRTRSRCSARSGCRRAPRRPAATPAPDQLAGEDPHPAALDLAAVQPLGQHLLHGRVGQLLVGRVGQRRQGPAAQPTGRHPEQLLQGVVGDDDPPAAVQHAGRGGRLLDERLRPERAGRSPPPASRRLAPVRPHSAPPTFRRVRAMHGGRPDWPLSGAFIASTGFGRRIAPAGNRFAARPVQGHIGTGTGRGGR